MRQKSISAISQTRLLIILTTCFYALLTLIPNSHSLMGVWPSVLLVQLGLLSPVIWLLWEIWTQKSFPYLGNRLDWVTLAALVVLILSTSLATFPSQAVWYSWIAICYLAAVYAVTSWLNRSQKPEQLLLLQGYLSITFMVTSLITWTSETLLPELDYLKFLNSYGVGLALDFSELELRNWAPLGHQNYVAGYLLLAIPLLIGLFLITQGKQRWIWLAGSILGLLNLYTTHSRGAWLTLVILLLGLVSFLWLKGQNKPYLLVGVIILLMVSFTVASPRLLAMFSSLAQGEGGELSYRLINLLIGAEMGRGNPISGVGLGGIVLLYQKYLPFWGGRESELAFQLHSTPAQLWAELGLGGIILPLIAIALLLWLLWRRPLTAQPNRILVYSLYSSLGAYSLFSIFDYQLDNIAISGTLVIFIAYLAYIWREPKADGIALVWTKELVLAAIGIIGALLIWLFPIHRAWFLSHQGFTALNNDNFTDFQLNLTKAHQLVPWEPYYPYQLGWNLGNIALETGNWQLVPEAIAWLQKGIEVAPYWEFGHSSLGWLLISDNPSAASHQFAQAAQLVPIKRGVFYGLGLSFLAQQQQDLAVRAFTLEALRDPLFITSPIWRSPQLQLLYPLITAAMLEEYDRFLAAKSQPISYWHQCRGGLLWWLGEFQSARADLEPYGTFVSKLVLDLAEADNPAILSALTESKETLLIQAWLKPAQRVELLQKSWILATHETLTESLKEELIASMSKADSFWQWVTTKAPSSQYRRQRLGFGLVTRHLDGPAPVDFLTVVDNVVMTELLEELLPSPVTDLEVDITLQPLREQFFEDLNLP